MILKPHSRGYAASNPFRFATKYTDIETGLVQYNTRYYSPSLGRFINRDSIGEAGGQNLYAYVSNRVPNSFDYLGMDQTGKDETVTHDVPLRPVIVTGSTGGFGGFGGVGAIAGGGRVGPAPNGTVLTKEDGTISVVVDGVLVTPGFQDVTPSQPTVMDPFIVTGSRGTTMTMPPGALMPPPTFVSVDFAFPDILTRLTNGIVGGMSGLATGATSGGVVGAGIGVWVGGAGAAPGAIAGAKLGGLFGGFGGFAYGFTAPLGTPIDDIIHEAGMQGYVTGFFAAATPTRAALPRGRVWHFGDTQGNLGTTDRFGNILIQPGLRGQVLRETVRHESVHRFFSPRPTSFLGGIRADVGLWGYQNSSLLRFIEEAIAEGYATRNVWRGLRFPFAGGYVTPAGVASESAVVVGGGVAAGYYAPSPQP